jgi:hypothetical protein
MRITPSANPAPAADPIAWLLFERRGTQFDSGTGRYDLTTLTLDRQSEALATLEDGRMTYPRDRGVTEFWYQTVPEWVRDGVDPRAARADAERGADAVMAGVEQAMADLAPFRVERNGRFPRNPESLEIWMRRDSGEQSRYIIPTSEAPASLLDAWRAAEQLNSSLRANYDRLDPELRDLRLATAWN